MPTRLACCLLAVLALVCAAPLGAQTQTGDLRDLWEQYPLEAPPDDQRPVGDREENGSLAGAPPQPGEPAGPFAYALLFLAFAMGIVGIAGGLRRGVRVLRDRREQPGRLDAGAGDLGG
jgi:hypothetical protein